MKTMMIDIYNNMKPLKTEILRSKTLMGLSEGLNLPKKNIPTDISNSIREIIDYLWADEQTNFEEVYDFEVTDQTTNQEMLDFMEANSDKPHIFYHILKVNEFFDL